MATEGDEKGFENIFEDLKRVRKKELEKPRKGKQGRIHIISRS